jgi:hypothetical protein
MPRRAAATQKRCPKGMRRNKKSGNCEAKGAAAAATKRCQKGYSRRKIITYGECEFDRNKYIREMRKHNPDYEYSRSSPSTAAPRTTSSVFTKFHKELEGIPSRSNSSTTTGTPLTRFNKALNRRP